MAKGVHDRGGGLGCAERSAQHSGKRRALEDLVLETHDGHRERLQALNRRVEPGGLACTLLPDEEVRAHRFGAPPIEDNGPERIEARKEVQGERLSIDRVLAEESAERADRRWPLRRFLAA